MGTSERVCVAQHFFFFFFLIQREEVNQVRKAENNVYLQGVFTNGGDLLTLLIPLQGLVIAKKAVGPFG